VELAGRRVALAICFDVHFIAREIPSLLEDADALLFPSAWVDGGAPEDSRAGLLPALACRFHLAIIHANWARSRPRLPGQGGSRILGPDGELRAPQLGEEPGIVVAEILNDNPPSGDT
jgi:predicted amidohydrolase